MDPPPHSVNCCNTILQDNTILGLKAPCGKNRQRPCYEMHMWLMMGHKSDKCDMRVLRVPVTWFLYFCPKIPTPDPCDMRDMRDMRFADL